MTPTASVICSECGKVLRGTERLRGLGFDVRRHKRPGGQECWGSKRTDHKPLPLVVRLRGAEPVDNPDGK